MCFINKIELEWIQIFAVTGLQPHLQMMMMVMPLCLATELKLLKTQLEECFFSFFHGF